MRCGCGCGWRRLGAHGGVAPGSRLCPRGPGLARRAGHPGRGRRGQVHAVAGRPGGRRGGRSSAAAQRTLGQRNRPVVRRPVGSARRRAAAGGRTDPASAAGSPRGRAAAAARGRRAAHGSRPRSGAADGAARLRVRGPGRGRGGRRPVARRGEPGCPGLRAPPPSRAWQALLDAVPTAEVMDLAPLDMWQVQNLMPKNVTAAQARLVARQSRGNPFWALQISASLDSAQTEVPPLARTLTDRLSRSLSTGAAAALAVVAAAGRIGVPEALTVLDHLEDPATALDEAVLAGVVVESGDRLSAAHPLIGAVAVKSLPPGRRAQLYRRLADASSNPERYAHFTTLAAGPGPDGAVAEALDAAAAAAHARGGHAAAAQFATQSVLFTPESDEAGLVRRRIRAAELVYLAGDLERSLEHLEPLDTGRLATADLERALPLLLDLTDFIQGTAAATAIVIHAAGAAGAEEADPRRRALVLALASDVVYGIPGGKRAAAIEAISCAEAAGAAANTALHRALVNLFIAKVTAAEGLDTGLLDRATGLEASLPPTRLHDSAEMHRAWSRYTEDLDTARAALQRSIARARDIGEDLSVATFSHFLATTEVLAGDYAAAAAAWYDWPPHPWHVEPRCELLIRDGDLDSAVGLVDRSLPGDADATIPARITARFMGACLRGKVSAWRGDHAATVRHLERAARCAEQLDWTDPGVRSYLDIPLAEAYVALGRSDDARRISARLREVGERLGRPALTGDAHRIEALAAAAAGDLDGAAESARAAVAAHGSSPLRLSWPAACWSWARSSGGARPAGSPATPCAGRTSWPPRWTTGRCWPKSSGSCRGWRRRGRAPS